MGGVRDRGLLARGEGLLSSALGRYEQSPLIMTREASVSRSNVESLGFVVVVP